MTRKELIEEVKNRIGYESDYECYRMSKSEREFYTDILKALEQEPILDKVRAEIENITDTMGVSYNQYLSKIEVLQIIDKYRGEG